MLLCLLLANMRFSSSKFWQIWWWNNAGNWHCLCPGRRQILLDFYGTNRLVEVYSTLAEAAYLGACSVDWRIVRWCRFLFGAEARDKGGKLGVDSRLDRGRE